MIKWMILNRKTVITYCFATFTVVFAGFTLYKRTQSPPAADYFSAGVHFDKWAQGVENDSALLKKLDGILDKHPELHAKYGALIAERLLVWNLADAAESYLNPVLKRVQNSLIYYPEFSKTSILISKGFLKEALEDAYQLKEEMSQDPSLFAEGASIRWEGVLYAFNLVRIGMLEQKVGTLEGEQKVWNEFLSFNDKDPEAFALVQQHFRENNLTLFDYIKSRKALEYGGF